nr:glycosyltransferase family 2 protein [uncultured Rhizobium sp.]
MSPSVSLAAIAKNEARYVREWLAYNLAVGFAEIIVFDNESTDDTAQIVSDAAAIESRIRLVSWPNANHASPQVEAYRAALPLIKTDWIAFFDLDEFVNPFGHNGLPEYLATLDNEISSVHLNWRCFGSGGRVSSQYDLVTENFLHCSSISAGNNRHYKTIARTARVSAPLVHDILTVEGQRILSDGKPFTSENSGIADRVSYNGIQLNHYQCKTYDEFKAKMERGDANVSLDSSYRQRDSSVERYKLLDINDEFDFTILKFYARMIEVYKQMGWKR